VAEQKTGHSKFVQIAVAACESNDLGEAVGQDAIYALDANGDVWWTLGAGRNDPKPDIGWSRLSRTREEP
jgi:hypothetical protein